MTHHSSIFGHAIVNNMHGKRAVAIDYLIDVDLLHFTEGSCVGKERQQNSSQYMLKFSNIAVTTFENSYYFIILFMTPAGICQCILRLAPRCCEHLSSNLKI